MKKRLLFIDRDGTIIKEPPTDYQVDSLEKFEFLPFVITELNRIVKMTDFTLVMVTNQDGLGTNSFPEDTFWPYQNLMLKTLESCNIKFEEIFIDRSFEHENSPYRKPGTKMLEKFFDSELYDLESSLVVGDRKTDIKLAQNLGCKAVYINTDEVKDELKSSLVYQNDNWIDIAKFIIEYNNVIHISRNTAETKIDIKIYPGNPEIRKVDTKVKFFDHMLMQLPVHGCFGIELVCDGDVEVDEHHTIEDVALALGSALEQLWRKRKFINRYAFNFSLPMDDCLAKVDCAIDLGGRPWLIMDADFKREKIGDFPTEMIFHFFKSLCDNAKCNLNIKAEGFNEHHKLEGIFKAFAKCLKQAINIDFTLDKVPSSKGML